MSDPLAPSCERCGSRKVLDDAYECAPCWERTMDELDHELERGGERDADDHPTRAAPAHAVGE